LVAVPRYWPCPTEVEEVEVRVVPLAIVNVALVAGAVTATLLIEVAVAAPIVGVVNVGDVDKTTEPEPVDDVTPVPPLPTPSVPVTPVVSGSPVALVNVIADGVPRFGVTNVGEMESTLLPVPVLATETRFLLPSVAIALEAVKPLRFRDVPEAAPIFGVTSAGDVARTTDPDPVDDDTPVPPAETDRRPPSTSDVLIVLPQVATWPTVVLPGPVIVPAPMGPKVILPAR